MATCDATLGLAAKRALFLDRDGVIHVDRGYVHRIEDVEYIDGIFDLARAAVSLDLILVVVTNQAGIGRGYYSESDFFQLMVEIRKRFEDERAPLSAVYHCPHHPEHGIGAYQFDCQSRKPNPGMLLKAAREHRIFLGGSALLGDRETDMIAGARAGLAERLLVNKVPPNPESAATRHYETVAAAAIAMPRLAADLVASKA